MTPDDGPEAARVEINGVPMSALLQQARRPRAVVLALHGGATTSVYFDAPGRPRLSLLRTGAALGFTVIALDRPGYGGSAAHAGRMSSAARRVELAYAAVDRLLGSRPRGAGVFVMAHSRGCDLALRMAGDERGAELLGLELAGTGRRMQPRAVAVQAARREAGPSPNGARTGLRDLLWGPSHLYPAEVAGGAGVASPAPAYEGVEAEHWMREFPRLAARVRVPVRYTLGDHERWWSSGPPALADIAGLFTASSRVAVGEQADGGHNLSLGLSARAYHLKVLAFAEECVLARENALSASGADPVS